MAIQDQYKTSSIFSQLSNNAVFTHASLIRYKRCGHHDIVVVVDSILLLISGYIIFCFYYFEL